MSVVQPLVGTKVLEIAGRQAGAGVGRILADLGASITKIIHPNYERTPAELWLDRGKGIRFQHLSEANIEAMLETTDVVIENGRPGRLSRFGLDAEAVRNVRPEIVHLSLPGFPATDPRSKLRSSEGVICAAAGLYAERGWSHALRGNGPAITDMPMASAYATAFGTLAVLVALLERRRDGVGDTIEVSLHNALLEGLSYNHLKLEDLPNRYVDRRARWVRKGAKCDETTLQRLLDPVYRSYRCADGRYFYLATPPHRDIVPRTLSALGLWDELIASGLPLDYPYAASDLWKDREEGSIFGPPQLADRWFDKLYDGLVSRFAERPASAWADHFRQAGLSGQIVQTREEWRADPHALQSGLIDQESGMPGVLLWPIDDGPRGEADPVSNMRDVTILDLANVIAGPTCAGALARFGPRIIKIDAPSPNFDPYITVVLALQYGRGKDSMLLDVRTPPGRDLFHELVRKSDVITYNGAPSQPGALGIAPANLRALNPRAALVQVSAYGGPYTGPKSDCRGYDEILQAATGIMAAHREGDYPPEEFAQFGCVDVLTGLLGSCATMAAILSRGASWATSLAAGAQLIQLPLLCGESGVGGRIETLADGFYYLDEDVPPISDPATLCVAELDARVATHDWAGHRVTSYQELRATFATNREDLPDAMTKGMAAFTTDTGHPVATSLTLLEQTAVRRERPIIAPARLEKYGQSTRAICAELGCSDAKFEDLKQAGVVAESWPQHTQFLPV
ncbi:Formyl-coenzyme A transferase [Tsuneonella dongtanensis]|uniref:Formyl-coenzyme A transferase n=1 Tax=Tsuneonella dongtanensis TaxID=692370 RepID=A0A1B2A917_9SPHN|nr:CoA transferase [Tsuneonella dongtanensis]ANY18646.1 Formyl-coenzyme A transferase [Tsuneonella dongtanensis]